MPTVPPAPATSGAPTTATATSASTATSGGGARARPQLPRQWSALLLGAVLMLGLLGALGLLAQSNFSRLARANQWSLHTYRVLGQIDLIRALLDSHEAQLRGFTLTGGSQFVRQLQASKGRGVRALRELRVLTRDNALQQQRLNVIEPQYLDYKRAFVNQYQDMTLAPGALAAAQRRLNGQTLARSQASAALQNGLRQMEVTERTLLSERGRDLDAAQSEAWHALIGGSVFALLLAPGLTLMLARSVRGQHEASLQTESLNATLRAEVAERRTVEESLRASEAGFRHLAEDSLDLICRHAPDGTLTYVSPAARPLLGYSPLEITGVHPSRFRFAKTAQAGAQAGAPAEAAPSPESFGAQMRDTRRKPMLESYRHADGHKVWLEVVGHAIIDPDSGDVRAWHTTARDVSARVRDERERARLLEGLRAVVEIADNLIAAPTEAALLERAVEMARARLNLGRCSIYLAPEGASDNAPHDADAPMRGTFGTDENGRAVREAELFYDTHAAHDSNDVTPAPGERWIVRRDQVRHIWRDGHRVELPGRGWISRTPILARGEILGLFFHDASPAEREHNAIEGELVAVFCSLLGALLERGRTQTRMSEQQRLIESVAESAPIFLYSVDTNERFSMATGKVLGTLGFDKEKMVGMNIEDLMGADSPTVRGQRRALRGDSFEEEISFCGRWLQMWRQPLRDENGQISGMLGVGMDVTAQHQAQLALRASETRYRQVADSLQEVLFQTDTAGRWSFLNPAWTDVTGQRVDQALGAPAATALIGEDRAAFRELVASARAGGPQSAPAPRRVLRFSTRADAGLNADFGLDIGGPGEVRHLEVSLRANFDENGEFRGTAGTLSDVTEKLRAEIALRQTLEMQRAILQGATYAIVSTDAAGLIQSFNPAAQQLFGASASSVVGQAQPTIFHDANELRERAAQMSKAWGEPVESGFEALVARARREGSSENEWRCLRADGTAFPMRISHSVLRDESGHIAGYVSIGYDLTETRRAEQLKNEFVSVVSHELRTPLTSIRGALGLLSGGVAGELPPAAKQMIAIAQKNSDRLVLLINDILDIEKIESGKMRFDMNEISLSALLECAIESNRGYAQTLGVGLQLEPLPRALQGVTLTGDEARLQQVLSNLLSNACKWTPRGSDVRLRARLHRGRARIEVRDAGPGVPPAFESRLFERFAQADGSATREKGGTGLGLAVTLAIVEKHGGHIGYLAPDADAGRAGATFYFELDAHNLPVPALDSAVPALNSADATRGRMLIVEDDAEVAAVLQAILENANYEVELATSCAQALELARARVPFSGATLDLHLPDGDGLELLEQLRELPATRELPVVIVSSFCEEGVARSSPFQIEHWLNKPVEPRHLLQAISGFGREGNGSNGRNGEGKARVLHVEDDADIRRVTELILGDAAHIVTAATLAQARALLCSEAFDLALLDIGLPDGNGLELLELLESQSPPVPVVLFSAREEEAETASASASNVAAALIKSRTPNDALRAKVEELLAARARI